MKLIKKIAEKILPVSYQLPLRVYYQKKTNFDKIFFLFKKSETLSR